MSKRQELYQQIKGLGLQDEVKAVTGDNYTRASNTQLETIINNATAGMQSAERNCNGLKKLVEILHKKNILLKSEVAAITKI